MLVLSRLVGERIFITAPDGTRLTIALCDLERGKAKIGVDAPDDWTIHREEVQTKLDQQKANGVTQ